MRHNIHGYREPIERALAYSGGTHTFNDVVKMVRDHRAQLWTNRDSAAVTEILFYPQKRVLHCFLAGGKLADILEMMPYAAQWGQASGCTGFTVAGRKGWSRVLSRHGWRPKFTVMEMPLQACYGEQNMKEAAE